MIIEMANSQTNDRSNTGEIPDLFNMIGDVLVDADRDSSHKDRFVRQFNYRGTLTMKQPDNKPDGVQTGQTAKEESAEKAYEVVEEYGTNIKVALLSMDFLPMTNKIRKTCVVIHHSYLKALVDLCFIMTFAVFSAGIDFQRRKSRETSVIRIREEWYSAFMFAQNCWFLGSAFVGRLE